MYYSEDCAAHQGLFYMKKSFLGKEGHPPSRIKVNERFNERNVDPFALRADNNFSLPLCGAFRDNETNNSNIVKNPSKYKRGEPVA